MARFETTGVDDSIFDDLTSVEINCPICNKTFEISMEEKPQTVTCPHCNAEIDIEHND